jgi:RNA polymerase sigma-70 factor (ECF subfamily)
VKRFRVFRAPLQWFQGWIRYITIYHQGESGLDKISYDEIIRSIQNLSPAYRTVLTLFIVEGYTHEEIANCLGISEGTSKSNLAKAGSNYKKLFLMITK